ncbi:MULTISPECIES: BrnA antitoxin family protein [unclassified Undibacterium]|nr:MULTISPECIES: BrnA antitoxin family protein [unclassified Undibacterium]MEB0217194.1 BrnA antitoxin family protein [Undibacterium sp. 5I2]WPX42170.1 BrnA antitoxin family protein [Undibacterium sp. CCC3.4]
MQIKSKSGRLPSLLTADEDALATAAALSDPDNLPWTDQQLAELKLTRPRGRPFGSGTKEQITLRIDRTVLAAFRAGGAGWQTRINRALEEWLSTH